MLRLKQLLAGGVCFTLACAVEVPAADQLDFSCFSHEECSSGYRCVDGVCVPAGSPVDATTAIGDGGRADADSAVLLDGNGAGDHPAPDHPYADIGAGERTLSDGSASDGTGHDTASPDTALPDTSAPDTSLPDVAIVDAGLPNLFEVTWEQPSALTETIDPSRCETDPVVTADGRWLILTRPETAGAGCYEARRFHIFEWNDGAPVHRAILPKFDAAADENNPHPVAGEVAGRPGELLLVHTVYAAASELRGVWLQGDPPVTPAGAPFALSSINSGGAASSPTLTFDADRIAFVRDNDVYEAIGAPPDGYGAAVQLTSVASDESDTDPALSPDGRVLVFVRSVAGTSDDFDLWVARRSGPDAPFAAPVRLPTGDGEINTDSAEMDAFITSSGDLLYMSARDDGTTRRIYLARGFAP